MQKSKKIIFGVDEVGRGPLAGPVFAVAIMLANSKKQETPVVVPQQIRDTTGQARNKQIQNLKSQIQNKDSKKLSPKQREKIYNFLKQSAEVEWGIGKVSEKVIDKINILQATKLAMKKAVLSLEKKIGKKAEMLLVDGNFGIMLSRPQQSIIKGDERIFLISLASIIAKVERDNLMIKFHKKYPQYRFNQHKGYGTKYHIDALTKFGPCKIHRTSFNPVAFNSKIKS